MANDEARWIDAVRQGDRDAFRHLVDVHARPLFALCMRITRDAALAEDAVQEAFFNAYRHVRDFDGRSSFKTWLHRIAVNAALEQMRRRSQHEIVGTDAQADSQDEDFLRGRAAADPGPDERAAGTQIGRHIQDQLGSMTVLERTAFLLRHTEGQSINDISQTLSMNASACKQAIFRAVRKLRGALQPLR